MMESFPVPAARFWFGVISPDLKHACVDAPVPTSLDAMAGVTLSGDTLFVLDRRIVSEEQMQTWWMMYRIDTSACHWIPLARDV